LRVPAGPRPGLDPRVLPDPAARIAALDILRGFALLGMIVVHFHQRFRLSTADTMRSFVESSIGWLIWIGVEEKAWATFAFLFGVGFAVLLRRAERAGRPIVALYLRRLAALAVIAAALEIFTGFSILLEYALWGVPLLFMRKWPTRILLACAVVSAAAWTFEPLWMGIHDWITLGRDGANAALASMLHGAPAPIAPPASYADVVLGRIHALPRAYLTWRVLIPHSSFALFIVGVLAVRHGVFDEPLRHVRLIVAAMAIGLASWALAWWVLPVLTVTFAPHAVGGLLQYGLGIISEQWLAFTYIVALVLLLAFRPRWISRFGWMGLAGRMALTNYVFQCAVIEFLSSPFGLNLHLRPYLYLVGAGVLFLAEAGLSALWLSRFRFGPLEWAWRAVTYLQVPRLVIS
jgi:uncharacterized protein